VSATEALLTPELRGWIGRTTARRPLGAIGESDLRRYCHATGDFNPLWLDDAYARAAGYRGRLLPPLLVGWIPFSLREGDYAEEGLDFRRALPLPPHYTNVRNAGTEIAWLQPAYFGEPLTLEVALADLVAREGRVGIGLYITQEERVFNAAEELVCRQRSTTALFPAARLADGAGAGG
jgi:acyl dehydratase